MAVLSNADRIEVWAEYMRGPDVGPLSITKAQLRAAVDAADVWLDANAAAFNAAIPQPARGVMTAKQKARLLDFVIRRRFEVA